MRRWGVPRVLIKLVTPVAALLVCCASALGQCALCKTAAANSDNQTFVRSLNLAVLVLLTPPVIIFCAIFVLAYRYRKAFDERVMEDTAAAGKRS